MAEGTWSHERLIHEAQSADTILQGALLDRALLGRLTPEQVQVLRSAVAEAVGNWKTRIAKD